MRARFLVFGLILAAAIPAHGGSLAYVQCDAYESYLLIYKSTERFEELGKLRCGEKLEVLSRAGGYAQVRTLDGRLGWVSSADISDAPPPPQRVFTFGSTEQVREIQSSPAPAPAPARQKAALTNEDILAMHANHPGSDVILKKIKSSPCAFDTTPAALQRLRASGLPDKVILTMLAAPIAFEASERKAPENVQVSIPDGTSVEVQLSGNVSSEELQDGTIVEMSAAEDLVVNGVPIFVRGSPARARIMAVRLSGSHGDTGEVAWFMQDIVATSGEHIPVTFDPRQPGNLRTGDFAGYPFLVSKFHKGDPAIKAGDRRYRVVMHGETVLSVSQPLTPDLPSPKPTTQSVRQVSAQQDVQPEAALPAPPPTPSVQDEGKP